MTFFFWLWVLMFASLSIQRPPFVMVANDDIRSSLPLELHSCPDYNPEARWRSQSSLHSKFLLQIGLTFFVESLPCSIPVSFSSPLPSPFLYSFLLFFLPLPLDLHLHQHCHLRPRRGKGRRGFCILLSFNHLILFLLLLQ